MDRPQLETFFTRIREEFAFNLVRARNEYHHYYDRGSRPHSFEEGERIWHRNHKKSI